MISLRPRTHSRKGSTSALSRAQLILPHRYAKTRGIP